MTQDNRKEADLMKDIRAARAAYARAWRQKNPEKQKQILNRYWIRKAEQLKREQENTTDDHE